MMFRESTNQSVSSNAFQNEFELESLESDRLRVTILIGVMLTATLILFCFSVFSFEQFQQMFHGNFRRFLLCAYTLYGLTAAYLLFERIALGRAMRMRRKASTVSRYLNAFIETSMPSVGIIIAAMFLDPVQTLSSPLAFVYPVFIVLSALRLNFRLCIFTGAVAALEYSLLAMHYINIAAGSAPEPLMSPATHYLPKALLLFMTGVVTALVTLQIKKRSLNSFAVVEERNRISRTFGEYVSPAVMNKLMALKPDLRSEKRHVCVMFLDIRDFTTFAENKEPEEVVDYLESLFGFMIEIVNRHHGVINKFLGDGFMAVFGAPFSEGNDCLNAVEAAREILTRIEREVARGKVLSTTVGIGLHAGEVVTGSIGSSLRREYTVIGDVVNLAARLEKLNKQFGSQLLISETVWQSQVEHLSEAISMGAVQVKGRQAPIQIYRVA